MAIIYLLILGTQIFGQAGRCDFTVWRILSLSPHGSHGFHCLPTHSHDGIWWFWRCLVHALKIVCLILASTVMSWPCVVHSLITRIMCSLQEYTPVGQIFICGNLFTRCHRARLSDRLLCEIMFVKCNEKLLYSRPDHSTSWHEELLVASDTVQ